MSSSSSLKKISWVLCFVFLVGCQSLRTRDDVRKTPPSRVPSPTQPAPSVPTDYDDSDDVAEEAPPPPPAPVIPTLPKIGVILGAGGAKTYAHIGFLHELARSKVPVAAIGGVEFGAPMAALYANREQANDVEWQMFKLKEEDVLKKSILGSVSKNSEVTALKGFIGSAFARERLDKFQVPFACPSYNLKRNQVYLMNKGSLSQVMYLCMAYPPFFRPYQGSVSAVRDITALANYLRQQGANYIVFINVLQPPGGDKPYTLDVATTDNVLWSEIAGSYSKPFTGVDAVISLDTSKYGIMDFSKRREIMNSGAESASKQLKALIRKWGL